MNDLEVGQNLDDAEKLNIAVQIVLRDELKTGGDDGETPEPLVQIAMVAAALGITTEKLTLLLHDKKFLALLRGLTKARAALAIHGPGIQRLTKIIATGNSKDAIQAFRLLAMMTGDLKISVAHDHKLTFDGMREKFAGQGSTTRDPLGNIFDIKDGGDENGNRQP